MKGQQERQAAAAALTAYISKITGQPWSEEHAAEAEAVVEAIASYAKVQPTRARARRQRHPEAQSLTPGRSGTSRFSRDPLATACKDC
jgi:hypothetical protein